MVGVAPVEVEQVDPAARAQRALQVEGRESDAAARHLLGHAEILEHLHRAGVDHQRLGVPAAVVPLVDDAHGHAASPGLQRRRETGRSRADHQQIDVM